MYTFSENILTDILFKYDTVTLVSSRDMNFLTGFMTSYFCDVIFSSGLWRHIFVTSFLRRIYDVIFLWRHFFVGFMTSYFCDVISSSGLWRHIFVTSFLRRVYDVIFLWRHFFIGLMTSYFCDVISSLDLWRHILIAEFFVAKRTNF
jgi:hypothetical protein